MTRKDIWKGNSIENRKARWQALWALEDLPRPLWFIPADPMLAVPLDYFKKQQSVKDLFHNKDVQLRESLKFTSYFENLQRYFFHDDYVPRLQPQLGIGVFASAFGCNVDFADDQYPMTHPVIQSGEPASKVYDLPQPDVQSGLLKDTLEYADYFRLVVGDRYPIAMTDLQGPLDTAYLIWDSSDFMIAMLEHSKEVHHLMRQVTDLIIKFMKELKVHVKEFVPAHFPPVYLPDGLGLSVSEDVLAMISPKLYEEYSLPYINQLSEEFGGVIIHSCGNFEHQLDVLSQVHHLRGINFGVNEMSFESVYSKFGGKTVLIPHLSSASIIADYQTAYEWVEHFVSLKLPAKGIALMLAPDTENIHATDMKMALGEQSSNTTNLFKTLMFGNQIRKILEKTYR
jgi:hypothetical protein